jgi:cadmium resistance protein CadD (predicted permease)
MVDVLGQAVVMFAVTNIDDIVLLALYFGQARGDKTVDRSIVLGQYLGFGAILAISVLAAFGLRLLPESAIAYLGLIPMALGVRAGFAVWRHRADPDEDSRPVAVQVTTGKVASVTLSNGADNISVYIPVFAAADTSGIVSYAVVFLIMVGVWCAVGRYFATRPVVARALARWGHILLPIVLITIGTVILVEGDAFGL